MLISKDIFSKDNVNSGRQIEWDIAKAISIVAMIFIHTVAYSTFFLILFFQLQVILFSLF